MAGITDGVSRVRALVDGVSQAAQQQRQGVAQVAQAVSELEKVTQTTAAVAEENAAASEETSAQAEVDLAVVARLEVVVEGAAVTDVKGAPASAPVAHGQAPLRLAPRGRRPDGDVVLLERTGTSDGF